MEENTTVRKRSRSSLQFTENERIAAVRSYKILDTLPEKDFNNLTELAANICEMPIALIKILDADRGFLKSYHGMPYKEFPRLNTFCDYAIIDKADIFIIEDAREDKRFEFNPLVREMSVIFYAGVKLINPDGYPLGTLAIFDTVPRKLTDLQKSALLGLAHQTMILFEARKRNEKLMILQNELNHQNEELKNFAGIVSHDMKMPLANMILTSDMLRTKYGSLLDERGIDYLNYIKQSSFKLSGYISGLLEHYESDKTAAINDVVFDSRDMLEEIIQLLSINIDCEIRLPEENIEMHANKAALEQILLNLITNSLKYNDKDKIIIELECWKIEGFYHFRITDNGIGIPDEQLDNVFNLFAIGDSVDKDGNKGNGIGLSTVKKLITKMGGEISVSSVLGESTSFHFYILENDY